MDSTQLRNLAFLMSLGGLSLACPGDDRDETDGDGHTGGGSTTDPPTTSGTTTDDGTGTGGGTTSTGETTGTPTTSGTTGAVTETTGDSSAGFVTTRSTTTDTTDGTTGEPAPEIPVCTDFGDKVAMCFRQYSMDARYYAMYCNTIFAVGAPDGPECTEALEEFFVCINALDCMAFEAELPMPKLCAEQAAAAFEAACPSLGE